MAATSPDRIALHAFLERHRSFLITTHINPDGDGIGSEVAMALWLRERGKTVHILNDSPLPQAYRFLAQHHPVETWTEQLAEQRFSECDALLVLDTSNRQRIGRLADHIDQHIIAVAVIDHHVTHQGFGSVNVIEPQAAAAAEMVYDLIREGEGRITTAIAEALYIGLMTDTGSFRYSNTDGAAHRMAATLIDCGIDPQLLYARVNAQAPAGRLRFFGEVLSALEMLDEGRVAVLDAAPEHFQRNGLTGADTEGLVDLPRSIAGVEVVVLFSEVEPNKVKVSMRSTGRVAIDKIAAALNGGGHPHAAGAMVTSSRAEARARVLPELSRLVADLLRTTPAPAG